MIPRARQPSARSALALTIGLLLLCGAWGCGNGEREIREILESDRAAHLVLDARGLAANIADTLVSVDRGTIHKQSRGEVEAFFDSYFRGAAYHEWDDVEPPLVRVAPRGAMAWVVRKVRVDREEPILGGGTRRRRFVSAWTSTYERRDGRWKMTSVTSTFEPEWGRADRILAAARRRVGGEFHSLRALAEVRGPGGGFQVATRSARDGRVRIDFSGGPVSAIGRDARWQMRSPGAEAADLTTELETFVRGHEVHMNALDPQSRYGPLHLSGTTRIAGKPAWMLTGLDALDGVVEFFYSRSDSTPLGFRVSDHLGGRGPVTVEVLDWKERSGLHLPHRATFTQGGENYEYRFVEIEVDPELPDSLFARPGS